jgi:hypothetical protein
MIDLGQCTDGQGVLTKHQAEGWIVSPAGKRIARQCRDCADLVITEYREKLGQEWSFQEAQDT